MIILLYRMTAQYYNYFGWFAKAAARIVSERIWLGRLRFNDTLGDGN